jgi:hypothetical protein
MLEDDGFILVGRITLELPSTFLVRFVRTEAELWGPAIYAFRIDGEVVRIGKTESFLKIRMRQWEKDVSRALAGDFRKGGANPWETFEWRKRLTKHGYADFLARRGPTVEVIRSEEKELIRRYNPPLCNDSLCGRSRQPWARGIPDVAAAKAHWLELNRSS